MRMSKLQITELEREDEKPFFKKEIFTKEIIYFIEAVQQFKIRRKSKTNNALNQKRREIFDVKSNCEITTIYNKRDDKMLAFDTRTIFILLAGIFNL